MARATVIVMDACGVGALPDAAEYGDPPDANTLAHVAERVGRLDLPTLGALGLGNITSIEGIPPVPEPVVHGRLHPMGPGKESTTGHWELMGVVPQHPLPTYPQGFPPEVIEALERATGLRFCCNRPYSGTEVIEDFGRHHLDTGEVIAGEHAVGRVIARPFEGEPGSFTRREGRHDYAAAPPGRSYLDELQDAGLPVHAVGKIRDLFAGVGITEKHEGATNAKAIASVSELLRSLESGLIFVNLVETDQVYGHRHDVEGFHGALKEIDSAVSRWLGMLRDDDLLVLTADHGVDPNAGHTDHTREHAPLLARFAGGDGRRHDGPLADVGASVLRWLTRRDAPELAGNP